MHKLINCLLILAPAIGCNQIQLLHNSGIQAPTASELLYEQVLDNVAMFETEGGTLPYFCLLDSGAITVETTGTANLTLTWPSAFSTSGMLFSPSLERRLQNNWIMKPVNGGDHLAAMRYAYRITTGRIAPDSNVQCCQRMRALYHIDCCRDIPPPGWYYVGSKHHAPHHDDYVGNYGRTFVWVRPGREESLARLTFVMLQIAMEGNIQPAGFNPVPSMVPAYGLSR
jgi:hypothetical protein